MNQTKPGRLERLSRALDVFEKQQDTAKAALSRIRKLLDQGSSVFDRHHFSPGHLTASAFVLSPDRAALLLVRHGKLNMWLQPGGHIELGDADIEAAARRELGEETSLERVELLSEIFDLDVHTIPQWGENPQHEHFDVRVLFLASELEVLGGDDALEARWFDLHELVKCEGPLAAGLPTDASVQRVAACLIAREKPIL